MNIRTMRIGDLAQVHELIGELGFLPNSLSETQTRFEFIRNFSSHELFVAKIEGKVVGWVHVYQAPSLLSSPTVEIGGLVVSEKFRRKGVGKALMAAAHKWAIQVGSYEVLLATQIKREDAHAFYKSLGYTFVHTTHFLTKSLSEN